MKLEYFKRLIFNLFSFRLLTRAFSNILLDEKVDFSATFNCVEETVGAYQLIEWKILNFDGKNLMKLFNYFFEVVVNTVEEKNVIISFDSNAFWQPSSRPFWLK
jgi:hypothetical protein